MIEEPSVSVALRSIIASIVSLTRRDESQDPEHSNFYVEDDDYGAQINVIIWPLTVFSGLILLLRVYCKYIRRRGLWWDDYVLIAGWVALVVACALTSFLVTLGYGRPAKEFDANNLETYLLANTFQASFSVLAATWSKTSFCIMVLRLSEGWIKRTVWLLIILINCTMGANIILFWAQCTPVEKTWKPLTPGSCIPLHIQLGYITYSNVMSGAMDIILSIVPWKIIWKLTINKKEKLGVLLAMSMGIFAGGTSLAKIPTLQFLGSDDFTRNSIPLVLLATAESAVSIVAASIPILRALFRDKSHLMAAEDISLNNYTNVSVSASNTLGTNFSYHLDDERELVMKQQTPRSMA